MKTALALCLVCAAAAAQAGPQRMVADDEAPAYAAVGRLNVSGNRHCTATLIAADLVLTAAHCLYHPVTGRLADPASIRFVAGQRRDAYVALRGVTATATPPAYVPQRAPTLTQIAPDIALLALDEPIPADLAAPIPAADWARARLVSIVAYGQDRAYAASIREGCGRIGASEGVVALDCAVTFGVSGAPVLAPGPLGPVLVAVVSAMSAGPDGEVAYVVPAAAWIETLRTALDRR